MCERAVQVRAGSQEIDVTEMPNSNESGRARFRAWKASSARMAHCTHIKRVDAPYTHLLPSGEYGFTAEA